MSIKRYNPITSQYEVIGSSSALDIVLADQTLVPPLENETPETPVITSVEQI